MPAEQFTKLGNSGTQFLLGEREMGGGYAGEEGSMAVVYDLKRLLGEEWLKQVLDSPDCAALECITLLKHPSTISTILALQKLSVYMRERQD